MGTAAIARSVPRRVALVALASLATAAWPALFPARAAAQARDPGRGALAQAPGPRPGDAPPRTARAIPETAAARILVGVVHVRFGFDRADLDDSAEAALAEIVSELRGDERLTIDLDGATDPAGGRDYNLRLSRRRVEAVTRWLVARGVDPARIIVSTARGPLLDDSLTADAKRRVMVKLMTTTE